MFWNDHNLSAWGWIGMTFGMIAVWGVLITGIVLLVRSLSPEKGLTPTVPPRTPEQLLAERFARGDIDAAEYHDRLDTLQSAVRS
jgi:putative membrane protein